MVEMIKYANEKEGEGMEDAKIIQLYWDRKLPVYFK